MSDLPSAAAIRGTTMRWHWTEGPTKGLSHEHLFHDDGTVEWHDAPAPSPVRQSTLESTLNPERVPYAAFEVRPDVYAVSYRAGSGFTLTVVLDMATRQLVGIASGGMEWHPVRGTFELMRSATSARRLSAEAAVE
jgi:hypothetical protein